MEQKKEYLKSYQEARRREKRIEDEIQRLRMDKMFPSVVNDDMPHGTDRKDLSDYMVLLEEQIEELKKAQLERDKLRTEIEYRIRQMDDETEKEVLRMKYIENKSFELIAVELGYTCRHAQRIHGGALKNFQI